MKGRGKGMGLLLALGPKPKGEEEEDMPSARMAAARAVLSALKSSDAEALDAALQDHYDACRMSGGGGDYE